MPKTYNPHLLKILSRRGLLIGLAGAGVAVGLAACARRGGPSPESVYPPLGRFVEVPGGAIHMLDEGPRDAPAVVLIHGASGNLRDFAFDFVTRLKGARRVIAVDRPGLGFSPRGGPDMHRPDRQAARIRAAVRAIGVERAVIVGHSWGAAAALAWALDAPESASGVVALAGATHPWPGGTGFLYTLGATETFGPLVAGAMRAFLSEEGAIGAVERIFAPQEAPDGYARYVGVGLALREETLRNNAQDIANLKDFLTAQKPRYRGLATPVEVIHGDADRILSVETHAKPLAEAAPRARLTVLEGVGHMPHHAAPDSCVAAIDRLIGA